MVDLVTGGAGFIGSHLVDALVASGRRVIVVDNLSVGNLSNLARHSGGTNVEFVQADVADAERMNAVMKPVQRVFHLAALADIVPSVQSPHAYMRANVDGTFTVLEAARAAGARRFVYAASSSCYGLAATYPTPETAPTDPRYPYALTKLLGEQLVTHWAMLYGLPAVSLRFFNVYGPRARTSGTYGAMFGVFLAQLRAKKPLTVVGDGNQSRDFVFVTDVVRAIIAAADGDVSGGIFNVGSGRPISVNEIVGHLNPVSVVHVPKRPGEPERTHADITAIRESLSWEPRISIAEGISVMLENIDYWREAPVWDTESIAAATADWFKYVR